MNQPLSINLKGTPTIIEPSDNGMFDLEQIWAKLQLGDQSHPEMWDEEIATHLLKEGHLFFPSKNTEHCLNGYYASLEGLITYCMWADTEFMFEVLATFRALTENN